MYLIIQLSVDFLMLVPVFLPVFSAIASLMRLFSVQSVQFLIC